MISAILLIPAFVALCCSNEIMDYIVEKIGA